MDSTLLLGVMKFWLHINIILPKLSWYFTVFELSLSFVKETLHAMVLPYLKLWCGIPKGGNSAILFCGPPDCMGLSLRPAYTVDKACQVVLRSILKRSLDPTARLVSELELARQVTWSGPRFAAAWGVLAVEAYGRDVNLPSHHHGLAFRPTAFHPC